MSIEGRETDACAERRRRENMAMAAARSRATEDADILAAAAEPLRVADLRRALDLTTGDRHRDYGEPVENHRHIASIFNAVTGRDLSAWEVAMLLHAVKVARLAKAPRHADSYVDGMAYLGIAHECAEAQRLQHPQSEDAGQPWPSVDSGAEGGL